MARRTELDEGRPWRLADHPGLGKGKVVGVVVLDGWGEAPPDPFNCIHVADTPTMDALKKNAPEQWRLIKAHRTAVGLPTDDDMGNSEVGHNALGAGQIYAQGAKLVDLALASGKIYEGEGFKYIQQSFEAGTLHLIGLLSDGGVHSRINQLQIKEYPCSSRMMKVLSGSSILVIAGSLMPSSIEPEYPDVDGYRELYHTYEMDAIYVKYYGEISKKINWIEDFLHMDARSPEWSDMKTRGWRQSLRIAAKLPHMTVHLAALAYHEYIKELREDASLKDLDLVYFEIWRLVVKDNREYMEAVREVLALDMFHMHKCTMKAELMGSPVFLTMRQRIYDIIKEGKIVANTEDNKARDLFRVGVARLKTKNMAKYAEKKMEIAERLNLHERIENSGNNVPGPARKH